MKQPTPWFRASKQAWFVQHNGKQCRLGDHPEGTPPPKKSKSGWNVPQSIMDAFYKLMARDPAALPRPEDILAAQVCDLFLDHAERHNEPGTYRWYRYFLQSFCERCGRVLARDLKPIHVTRWLDANPDWDGGRRNAVIAVKRAFNWADRQGVLSPNPLRNVEKPRPAAGPGSSLTPSGPRSSPPSRTRSSATSSSRSNRPAAGRRRSRG